MPVNASPEFVQAEARYHQAKTPEEKVIALEEMLITAPKHKSSENLLSNLKTRYKKLKQELTKSKKKSSTNQGIKKSDMQAVMIGKTNSGKSSLLKALTNANPEIANYHFTTTRPAIGMLNYNGVQIQLIENPAINSETYDRGLTNSADTIILIINKLEEILELEKHLEKFKGKKIIVFNKSDILLENEKRRVSATLQSKKYNFILTSAKTQTGIDELKERMFKSFNKIRVYTKEPGKSPDMNRPIILNPDSTIKNVAEKILHGFSKKVKQARVTGPSGKFPNQKIGLKHIVKDLDIVEFKTD